METLKNIMPKDRLNIIFIIFFINGIGTLLPWNMLINADKYFTDYKLNITTSFNDSTIQNYHTSFLSYLGIASKAPNILLQIINMFVNSEHANLSLRIKFTLIIQMIVFLFIILLAIIDTTSWPGTFFWLTMISAIIMNLANGVYQGCCYGLAARFPMKYTNAITTGMNFSGTIAALLMILSIAMSPKLQLEAIIFFSCAVLILLICLIGEFFVSRNEFYKFYSSNSHYSSNNNKQQHRNVEFVKSINNCPDCFEIIYQKNGKNSNLNDYNDDCPHLSTAIAKTVSYNGGGGGGGSFVEIEKNNNQKIKSKHDFDDNSTMTSTIMIKLKEYFNVLRSIWSILLNLILIYMVSLSLFPALLARIKSSSSIKHHDDFLSINETYFSPVYCFLFFNLFATIGNFFAQYVQWPGPRYLIIFTLTRLLFIPYFLYCNYQPEENHSRKLPVLFDHDWMFIVGVVLMSLSSGYLSSLCMMYAPKCVEPKYSTIAGMMSALTIILGILIGMNLSLLYPYFVLI